MVEEQQKKPILLEKSEPGVEFKGWDQSGDVLSE